MLGINFGMIPVLETLPLKFGCYGSRLNDNVAYKMTLEYFPAKGKNMDNT